MHIGVVGLGYWGSKHLRVVSGLPEVGKVTAFDVDPLRLGAAKTSFPSIEVAESYEALLDVVDGVILATHASTHAPLALTALRAGRHVLVEKPLALDSRDGEVMVALAEAMDLTLMVGHTFAYHPAVQTLRDVVAGGGLGEILHIECQRLNLGLFQSDCDVVWDLAPHDLSIVSTLLGTTPSTVQCWARGHIDPAVVDSAYLRLAHGPGGPEAVVHVSWLDPHKTRRVTVVGTERMAIFDDVADDLKLKIYDKGIRVADRTAPNEQPLTYRYGDVHCPYVPPQEPLMLEDRHFVACVLSAQTPLTDGRAGLGVVRALEAASQASLTGQEVAVPGPTSARTAVLPAGASLAGRR